MPVIVSMLRAVNVGGHNQVKMDALRALYELLKLREPQTYVQSGNVVFKSDERDLTRLSQRIQNAIEKKFGIRPEVILRTAAELRSVIARNPFAKRRHIAPSKLLVVFLAADPGTEARDALRKLKAHPEELHIVERELYIYYPNGMGRTKLPLTAMEKILKTPGTGRNWSSVTKMLAMAEELERA